MRILLLGACCAFAACGPAAAPPSSRPSEVPSQIMTTGEGSSVSVSTDVRTISETVDAPVERVWAVLPAVYAELGLGGGADEARRTVAGGATFTRRFAGQSATRMFDCGQAQFGAEIASTYTIRFTVSTTVNPGEGTGSRLDTMVQGHARSNDGANAVSANCRTEGAVEALIATRVREKLAG